MRHVFSEKVYKVYKITPHKYRGLAQINIHWQQNKVINTMVYNINKCGQYKLIYESTPNLKIKLNQTKLLEALTVAKKNIGEKGLKILNCEELIELID